MPAFHDAAFDCRQPRYAITLFTLPMRRFWLMLDFQLCAVFAFSPCRADALRHGRVSPPRRAFRHVITRAFQVIHFHADAAFRHIHAAY